MSRLCVSSPAFGIRHYRNLHQPATREDRRVLRHPETTTGGRALKFYRRCAWTCAALNLKEGSVPVGNRTRVKVVKNKMAPPFKQAEFDIVYGQGISREGGIIDMGVDAGVVRKSGSWYTYEGDQLGQGKEKSRQFLKDNPEIAEEIQTKVMKSLGIGEYANVEENPEVAEVAEVDESVKV